MRSGKWVLGLVLGVAAGGVAQAPVRISGGVMAAQVLTRVEPVYPPIAQAAGVSGAVVLHAVIGDDGLVKNLQVVSGPEMLRGAALDAVRQWTYRPYVLNGVPTAVDTTVTVSFGGGMMGGYVPPPPPPAVAMPPPGVARIAGGVMAGQILTKVSPVYPPDAKANGVSGVVVMRALISKQGAIENLTVVSGPEELRASATDAVSQWTYKPYLLNGEATEVDTTITVNYTLGSAAATARSNAAAGDDLGMFDGPPQPGETNTQLGPGVPGATRIGAGVMAGMIVKKVAPVYPASAKAHFVTGSVVMRAIIGKDGTISSLRVVSGPEELRDSAMDAVKKWRYKPYTLCGVPTEVDTTITVNYAMGG